MLPAHQPSDNRSVQQMRSQNRALRELVDRALGPANYAPMPRTLVVNDEPDGVVDFRIRGVFRRRDYRVLVSQQDAGQGSKILTSEGVIE